ncbi:hypothetical protein CRG98_033051, partial [Punica granatum]
AIEKDGTVVEALRARRQLILDNIRDNDEAGINYRKEIEANEKLQCELQHKINEAINNHGNKTYLRILSQYRLQEMANTELQLEVAMRDQIIHRQRDAQRNLWNLLMGLGLDERRLLDLAAWQGIPMEDYMMAPYMGLSNKNQSPNPAVHRYIPSPCTSLSYSTSSSNFEHYQNFENGSMRRGNWNSFCREERHMSYYFLSDNPSPSAQLQTRKSECWVSGNSGLCLDSPNTNPQNSEDSNAKMECRPRPYETCSSVGARSLGDQHEDPTNDNGWYHRTDRSVHSSSGDSHCNMRREHVGRTDGPAGCNSFTGQCSTTSFSRNPMNCSDSSYNFPSYGNVRPSSGSYCSPQSEVLSSNIFTPRHSRIS